ncbi:MAG: hypothetical protein ACRCST_12620 [Turicibacter sp.]
MDFIFGTLQLIVSLGVIGAIICFWGFIFRLLYLANKALKIYITKNS